jgi:hypothetical protein
VNESAVRTLAEAGALPLSVDREREVATVLSQWLPQANALSQKMRHPRYQAIVPITVFVQVPPDGEA